MKKIIIIALIFTFSILGIKEPQVVTDPQIEQSIFDWFRTFAQVVHLTTKKHFHLNNIDHAMTKAIDCFLNEQDPHSSFLDPETYKVMTQTISGEFYGIGVMIDNTRKPKDKYLTIIDTIPGGPADKMGVKPLDKMVEIEGKPLEGVTTEQAMNMLKGEKDSKVNILVLREGSSDLIPFTITRDAIKEHNLLCFYIKSNNIMYIGLSTFSHAAINQIEQALRQSQQKKLNGVIIDLRNNTGGLLAAAIEIAGFFLKKNSLVVSTKDKNNKSVEEFRTNKEPIHNPNLPVIFLTNQFTASASEILAGSVKLHAEKSMQNGPLIFVLGTDTFGKGSVQEVISIGKDSAIRITTQLYELLDNTPIQGKGIKPDFVVEKLLPQTEQMRWFARNFGQEKKLTNTIEDTQQKEEKDSKATEQTSKNRWMERAKEMLQADNQLHDAIDVINMITQLKTHCPHMVSNRSKAIEILQKIFIDPAQLQIEEVKTSY